TILCDQISESNYLEDTSSEVVNAEIKQLSTFYNGRIMLIDNHYKVKADTYDLDLGKTIISSDVIKCFKENGISASQYDKVNQYIEITSPILDKEKNTVIGVMLVSVSTNSIADTITILERTANLVLIMVVALVVLISFLIGSQMIKPFRRITQSIEGLTEGYDDDYLHVNTYLETEVISDAFNKMLGRMKVLDDSRQEFVSNVSHELKTPLTSMKVLSDALLSQENVPNELYKEFMTDMSKEIDRENVIINDLLSLVKMDKTSQDLNIKLENINELVERILKRLRPVAAVNNIELIFESYRKVMAEVDEVKLSLALSNLVENAIKYNRDNGMVKVTLDADHKWFTIDIADSGIGISKEDQEHIFERFYRVDKSHSREIGGTGLGLSIARSATLMHRGAIKLESEIGIGTIFHIRIPLNYISS
ncbi:MAG TPA: HAMP domain-containing histidine kinase, partial [Candidatus Dorea intestinavium]|nr:HAMP domain-containing histidine kinase [Candidatus Dorea intestinavium]